MDLNTLLPDPKAVRLTLIRPADSSITLVVKTVGATSLCPLCNSPSSSIHSRYTRSLADLPWHGIAVRLLLHTRKFFCKQPTCPRRIFCERLPGVAASYARHSIRLNQLLELIGFAIGGKAGARLAHKMLVKVSPTTLLRRVRRAAQIDHSTPRVLGVDDWAFRRGSRYGTILVDLERRQVIDLLLDRDARTLSGWLEHNPGVELISRDRASAYAEAARQSAPFAIQVADRWHLLKNLTSAVEHVLQSRSRWLGSAAELIRRAQVNSLLPVIESGPITMLSSHNEQQVVGRRRRHDGRYQEVMRLYGRGVSKRAIAKAMKVSRQTVDKYTRADCFPQRAQPRGRKSRLNRYLPYLHRRWAEGCDNARQLWRELVEQGYTGKDAMVRRYVWRLRKRVSRLSTDEQIRAHGLRNQFRAPSTRSAAWWLLKDEGELKEDEQAFIEQLMRLCPEIATARELAQRFRRMIKQREVAEFDVWLEAARGSTIKEMRGFADGVEKDREAVRGALQYGWSNGQVEGQVNRLKLIKRQM